MDALGIPFALGCIVVWMGFVLLVARFCGRGERLAEAQRRAERCEVDGPMASIADLTAERQRRAARGQFRHATRFGRSA